MTTKYFTYILYTAVFDKYYIRQTSDLILRMKMHNELSENSFTSKYRPWDLVYFQEVSSRSLTMKLEKYLKGRKKEYYQNLITDFELQKYYSLAGIIGVNFQHVISL
ncbi:MAG: GIY-YIG nuclease family protein [Saprospiraceae bacterium]|nr:GIY-YIG nuclease family protein [Saprospiraceae bacterium]